MMEKLRFLIPVIIVLFTSILFSQDSTSSIPITPQRIQLNTYVEASNVPLNRPVILHIELSWPGQLNKYQIQPVSQPILTNLLLDGSGSENRLETMPDGSLRSIKAITYRFRPLEMGMAYIDGIVVKYTERESGQEEQLSSQRIMVEIEQALPEPGEGGVKSFVYLFLLIIFFGIMFYFIIVYIRKRRQALHSEIPLISNSEHYLNVLSQEVDPRGTNLEEMTGKLSRIFREYLGKEFGFPAREQSTQEIIRQLDNQDLEESERNNLPQVLEKLDIIKFAGRNIDPNDFINIYGAIEAFLIKRKQQQELTQAESKEEK
ncbi:MAG: hypothetical protein P8Y60_04720 [Calditrichota bacterium]|jgi:hypothetical protein